MTKEAFSSVVQGVHGLELACVFHRRQPGFQKIGAQRYQNIRFVHMVGGEALEPENFFIGGFQGLIGIGLKYKGRWRAPSLQ